MKIISHRGNINGRCDSENTQTQINKAISLGFDVEIDLWVKDNRFYLGHDEPKEECNLKFLYSNSNRLWIHAKNIKAVNYLKKHNILNWFWHDKDIMTLTSRGYIWSYINEYIEDGITVCPFYTEVPNYILGVCTDYPKEFLKNHD